MLERKYDDDDDDDGAFSQTESEGPPELDSSSSGDDVQDHQAAGSRSFQYSSLQHENGEYQALSCARNAQTSSPLTGDQSRGT